MTIQKTSKLRSLAKKIAYKYAFLFAYAPENQRLKFSLKYLPRGITSSLRMKPTFLIVGAPKCGTTSLYNYLIQHPMVLSALRKEVNYYTFNKRFGLKWFLGNFPHVFHLGKKITGEASPTYIWYPNIAKEIKSDFPKIKIIIILRDPVNRAYSAYNMMLKVGREKLTFEEALGYQEFRHMHPFWYREHGIYIEQIKPYFDNFPADQIKIFDFTDLKLHPQKLMDEVCDFLEIAKKSDWNFEIHNKYEYSDKINPTTRKWLSDFYRPYNEKLFQFLGRKFDWQ